MKLIPVLVLVALAGCENSARVVAPAVVPEGLKDCTFYELRENGGGMRVVRCPNSSTSIAYHSGKATLYTTTIEDEHAKAEAELAQKRADALAKLSDEDKATLGLK